MKRENTFNTSTLVKLGLMTALSLVMLLIRIPYPPAPFLVYDPADIPIYITAFAFGPAAGLVVTFIESFIQAFLMGGDGIYGFLMHFIATGSNGWPALQEEQDKKDSDHFHSSWSHCNDSNYVCNEPNCNTALHGSS